LGARHAWLGDLHVQTAPCSVPEWYVAGLIGDKARRDFMSGLTLIRPPLVKR
jgi:hypothetical protein